ncbi:MAG: hypothetical protein NTZ63_06835, partial [Candidatus Omnitrophica bacterium]|nr:hypothetical protein [Candidatus Omnitrophota bacterium]
KSDLNKFWQAREETYGAWGEKSFASVVKKLFVNHPKEISYADIGSGAWAEFEGWIVPILTSLGFTVVKSVSIDNGSTVDDLTKKVKRVDLTRPEEVKAAGLVGETMDLVTINNIVSDDLVLPALAMLKSGGVLLITFAKSDLENIRPDGPGDPTIILDTRARIQGLADSDSAYEYTIEEVDRPLDYPVSNSMNRAGGYPSYGKMLVVVKNTRVKTNTQEQKQFLFSQEFSAETNKFISMPIARKFAAEQVPSKLKEYVPGITQAYIDKAIFWPCYELANNIMNHSKGGTIQVYAVKGKDGMIRIEVVAIDAGNDQGLGIDNIKENLAKSIRAHQQAELAISGLTDNIPDEAFGLRNIIVIPDSVVIETRGDKWEKLFNFETDQMIGVTGNSAVQKGTKITLGWVIKEVFVTPEVALPGKISAEGAYYGAGIKLRDGEVENNEASSDLVMRFAVLTASNTDDLDNVSGAGINPRRFFFGREDKVEIEVKVEITNDTNAPLAQISKSGGTVTINMNKLNKILARLNIKNNTTVMKALLVHELAEAVAIQRSVSLGIGKQIDPHAEGMMA